MKKTTIFITLLVASLTCGAQQPSPQKPQSKAPLNPQTLKPSLIYKSDGKLHTRNIPSGTFDCDANPMSKKHKCKEIPIIVLTDKDDHGNPICVVLVPYYELWVHPKQKHNGDYDVRWKLTPPGYAFYEKDGIKITSDDGSESWKKVWKDGKRVSGHDDEFQFTLIDEALENLKNFHHHIHAYNAGTKAECAIGDPVISNDVN